MLEQLPEHGRQLISFARRLISTPSPTGSESSASRLLAEQLKRLGYRQIEIDEFGNVVAYFGDGEPRLMFNGHLDHVSPGGMNDPFAATLESGERWDETKWSIRGRGSSDMKASVAAGAFAAAFLAKNAELRGAYVFTADVQEEIDSPLGVQKLIKEGIRAEFGVSGESTGLDIAIGHRGKIQLDLTVHGRSSHASTPADGINAVYQAQPFVKALEEFAGGLPSDELFGPATITITGIRSDPAEPVAVVPEACVIRIDRRHIPGETPEGCVEEIRELVAAVAKNTNVEASVHLVNIYPLMHTPYDHPIVDLGRRATSTTIGHPAKTITWRFGVNATFMNQAGIPTVGIGAGDEKWAHTVEEHVPVFELVAAAQIYARMIEALCSSSCTADDPRTYPWHA